MLPSCKLYHPIIHLILFAALSSLANSYREGSWIGDHPNYYAEPGLYADNGRYSTSYITQICIKTDGTGIYYVKLTFSDGSSAGPVGTDSSNNWQCFQVETNECFVSIDVRMGAMMDAMRMVTSNDRTSNWWGNRYGGLPFDIDANTNECIAELQLRQDTSMTRNEFRGIKASFNTITRAPTRDPTIAPTRVPSKSPSSAPIVSPSTPPTKMTMMPTEPSLSPIQAPTVSTSDLPTVTPTDAPVLMTASPVIATNTMEHDEGTPSPVSRRESEEGQDLMYLVYIFAFICVSLCIVGAVYKTQKKKKKKPTFVIESQLSPNEESSHQQKHVAQFVDDEEDNADEDEFVDEEERKRIKQWVHSSLELPEYYDMLIANGFDKMEFIMDIRTKAELKEIGITLLGHQTHILSEIAKFKQDAEKEEGRGTENNTAHETEGQFTTEEYSEDSTNVVGLGQTTKQVDDKEVNASADPIGSVSADPDVDSLNVFNDDKVFNECEEETIC